jgi:glycosyltransferase involved in cell wall biosynthesis
VVASRTGGIPSMVRDGADGVLVAPEDPAALACALAGAAADPHRARDLACAGRDTARRCFSWPAIGDRIYDALARAGMACASPEPSP